MSTATDIIAARSTAPAAQPEITQTGITQTVLFTAIPNGSAKGKLRVLVHVSPRLQTSGTLADYPDWVDWPKTLAKIPWLVDFASLGTVSATPVAPLPESARWTALFPPATTIEGHAYKGFDHIKLHSYPVRTILDFLANRWARFGANDPVEFPTYADLVAPEAFGPIGFEVFGDDMPGETGEQRKGRLIQDNRSQFNTNSNNPADWAIEFVDSLPPGPSPALSDEIARRFLQLEQFHKRGHAPKPVDGPPPTPDPFVPDFHQVVAMAREYPLLQRMLGLSLELEFPFDSAWIGTTTEVKVVPEWSPSLPDHPPVLTRTACHIGFDAAGDVAFDAVPANPNDTDLVGRYLRLSDTTRFQVVPVDPDGGAIKAMQFADNLTRSRRLNPNGKETKFSFYTPDRYALPSLSAAGLSLARVSRASEMAKKLDSQTTTNDATFDPDGKPNGTEPLLYAEDLVRGYRFDVLAGPVEPGETPQWRSLMQRSGNYRFPGAAVSDVPVDEEGTIVSGATTAGGTSQPDDLYLQESLARWGGWSLAGRMPGLALGPTDEIVDPESTEPPAFAFNADLDVAEGTLPRLRFGETYRMRARTVDLTGVGEPLDAIEPTDAPSNEVTYFRYEPVPAPLSVLHDQPAAPGETAEIVVLRSEDGNDTTPSPTTNSRHLVPARSSVLLAEHHRKLDDTTKPGNPVDVGLYGTLATRDKQDLETHPDGQPVDPAKPQEEQFFPVSHLSLNYLPDPLARGALVRMRRQTPAGPVVTPVATVAFETAAWPDFDTFRLQTSGADTTAFAVNGRTLVAELGPAEDVDVMISTYLNDEDLDVLGLWPLIEQRVSVSGGPHTAQELRDMIVAGEHWMFTPWRKLRLVHAVRTPLEPPVLVDDPQFFAHKLNVGDTHAFLGEIIAFDRKSTGRVDVVGEWSMKIDTGPKGADPTVDHEFRAVAFEIPVDHRSGEEDRVFLGSDPRYRGHHEFGDTKYRNVTYTAVATSAFTDFYRQTTTVTMADANPVLVDAAGLEAATVKVTGAEGFEYKRGLAGDYTVDEAAGTIQKTPGGILSTGAALTVDYVAPEINTISAPETRAVLSSARPAAPKVDYVIPAFHLEEFFGNRTRKGNILRVYLQRPWWSSGDDEKLGVVLWRKPALYPYPPDPPEDLKPYISMWGYDPVVEGKAPPLVPTAADFALASSVATGVDLAEMPGAQVDVAAHDVSFDAERDLWFCDILVDRGTVASHWPFIRLALARYQPHSMNDLRLSSVVLSDFAQLAPTRGVSVTPGAQPNTKKVVVTGTAYSSTAAQNTPPIMQVTLEKRQPGVTDPDLGWIPARGPNNSTIPMDIDTHSGDHSIQWLDFIEVPPSGGPYRLVIEEIEVHRTYDAAEAILGPQGRRTVFIDIVDV